MRKIKFTFLLLLGLMGIQAQTLYLRETSGTQSTFPISSVKKISFSGTNLVLKTSTASQTYALNSLRYLNFMNMVSGLATVQNSKKRLQLFPNPAVDVLNIELGSSARISDVIEIFSTEGKLMCNEALKSGNDTYQLNVSHLAKGLYICKLRNEAGISTTKFLKQ